MPSTDDLQAVFDLETDTETIIRGEQAFHNTLYTIQSMIDPAYSFILYRFNRVAISQDRLDTIIFMDGDMQPTIGVNFRRFAELGGLARVSCIEHNVGHLISGHLGDQLGFKLQEYCTLKYGRIVGKMVYYLTIETVADCFVTYPGSVRSSGRVFYDIGKLGLDRWAPTISVLREIEKHVPAASDEEKMRQDLLSLAKEMLQPPTEDRPDPNIDKDGKSMLYDYEDLFRDVDDSVSQLTGGLPVNDLLVIGDKAEAMIANEQMQRMVKAAIDRTSAHKSRGYLAGDSKQFIEALDTPPSISLHQQISRACSSALSEERRT